MISILSKAATWSPEQPFGEAFSRVFSSRLCSAQLIWTAVIRDPSRHQQGPNHAPSSSLLLNTDTNRPREVADDGRANLVRVDVEPSLAHVGAVTREYMPSRIEFRQQVTKLARGVIQGLRLG